MRWNDWRLRTKMAVTFTSLFVVAVAVLGGLTYFHMKRDYTERTLDLVDTSLAQMTITLDLYAKDMDRLSLAIFGDPIIQRIMRQPTSDYGVQYDNNEIAHRLVQLTAPWPYIQGVYLFAEDGRLFNLSKGGAPSNEYSVRQEPWFAQLGDEVEPSMFFWPTGPETMALRDPQLVFSLIRPINDFQYSLPGQRLGYMKIDMSVLALKSLLLGVDKAEDALPLRYMLVDEGRNVLYDSGDEWTGRTMPDELAAAATEPEGSADWAGTRYLFSGNRSDYSGWTIVALAPHADVVKQSDSIRGLILVAIALAIGVVGAASYVLASGISRPLAALAQNMKRVETGDFKVRAKERSYRDETGRLSRGFNLMLESVDRLIHQVFLLELREKDAKLMALQAQINPHMLFNTLNIMKALSRKQGVHDVADMAENLADLFRYSMRGWNEPTTLEKELENVRHYVRIQEMRYKDRFAFEADVPDSLLRLRMAKLSLQPLVENAIFHGIEKKIEGGTVRLEARLVSGSGQSETSGGAGGAATRTGRIAENGKTETGGAAEGGTTETDESAESEATETGIGGAYRENVTAMDVEIAVTDTGPGMPEELVVRFNRAFRQDDSVAELERELTREGKSGIGLMNIHKRIRLLFGSPCGLRIESAPEGGTKVTIRLPNDAQAGREKE